MKRFLVLVAAGSLFATSTPTAADAQWQNPVIGAGIGVAGGAVITMSAVVFRARFQREYIDSTDDLIHWQSLPMILTPAVGVVFGLAGQEALMGSIIGSSSGLLIGAAVGAGTGWLLSTEQEAPWGGGVIGAGLGMTVGGLTLGLSRWADDEDPNISFPGFMRVSMSVPVQ